MHGWLWFYNMLLCSDKDISHILDEDRAKQSLISAQGGVNSNLHDVAKNTEESVASEHSHSPGRFK